MTRLRVTAAAFGAAMMAYAVAGALSDRDLNPVGVLVFLAGSLVAHDAVWMPVVLALGFLIGRLPARHRAVAQVFAVISAVAAVLALPLVLGVGRAPDNPSIQPLDYGRDLALILVLAAAGAALAVVVRARRRRPAPPEG